MKKIFVLLLMVPLPLLMFGQDTININRFEWNCDSAELYTHDSIEMKPVEITDATLNVSIQGSVTYMLNVSNDSVHRVESASLWVIIVHKPDHVVLFPERDSSYMYAIVDYYIKPFLKNGYIYCKNCQPNNVPPRIKDIIPFFINKKSEINHDVIKVQGNMYNSSFNISSYGSLGKKE